jgi:hypothetical protein
MITLRFALVTTVVVLGTMIESVPASAQQTIGVTEAQFTPILANLHGQEVGSLAGIKGMSVVIDQLRPDIVAVGLRLDDIRNDAETKLRAASVQILNVTELIKAPGAPFLKIKVDFDDGTTAKAPYAGLVKVALTQSVFRSSELTEIKKRNPADQRDTKLTVTVDNSKVLFAETWHTQRTFKATDIRGIRAAAEDLVKEFVHDYQDAQKLAR